MTRRRAAFLALLGAALVLAAAAVGAGGKRRGGGAARVLPPAPAGGAASGASGASDPSDASEGDGADDAGDDTSIVEDARRYEVKTWSFSLERFTMHVEDVGMTTELGDVLRRTNAELVVNGGFFDPNGKALGLAISDGVPLSRLSKAMSGGVLTTDGERARLWESETFTLPEATRFAIQCKPRLVVDGAPNVRRDDGRRSERTALCVRDGGRTVDVVVVRDEAGDLGGPSLFALGRFLARRGCESALNLDGGPSTGVAWRDEGGVRALAPRGGVRHAVVFRKR